jgi:hypothetical protein
MSQPIACLRCQTPMDPGFVADRTDGGNLQEQWNPGTPNVSFWTGLKTDRKSSIPVTTMRCPKCGALEFYAMPA